MEPPGSWPTKFSESWPWLTSGSQNWDKVSPGSKLGRLSCIVVEPEGSPGFRKLGRCRSVSPGQFYNILVSRERDWHDAKIARPTAGHLNVGEAVGIILRSRRRCSTEFIFMPPEPKVSIVLQEATPRLNWSLGTMVRYEKSVGENTEFEEEDNKRSNNTCSLSSGEHLVTDEYRFRRWLSLDLAFGSTESRRWMNYIVAPEYNISSWLPT